MRERYCGRGEGGGGNKAGDWIMDPRGEVAADGWDVLLPGAGIRCESVEGDHFGIMRRPGVAELGGWRSWEGSWTRLWVFDGVEAKGYGFNLFSLLVW